MRRADKEIRGRIEARAAAADTRMRQVIRRIEKGDVDPRPLPGLREDSLPSMESMPSMESSASMESMDSGDYASEVSEEEASNAGMMQDMPLEGIIPYDPESAHEDLTQRMTEETGSGGDPHAHNEAKAGEMAQQMTEETGAAGDMTEHAERKVDQAGKVLFEE